MLARLVWNLITLASVATLGGVVYFFVDQYNAVEARQDTVTHLRQLHREEGPCAALMESTEMGTSLEYGLGKNVEALRQSFVNDILSQDDARGRRALMGATRDGLISYVVCEQIKLLADVGEVHPVLALLRFSREKDPCEDELGLDQVVSGLGSHRSLLLRGLMEDVSALQCLEPVMQQHLADHVTGMLHDDPQAFDDLDVLRIARYVTTWSPMRAAQIGCRIDATGDISRLGSILGCTPDQRERVLTKYRYPFGVAAGHGAPEMQAGAEVLLLWEDRGRCEVRPVAGPPRVARVACDDLELISGLELGVLVERVRYGVARADLISGVVSYDGSTKQLGASKAEPPFKSWFAYDRHGQALGTTRVASLAEIAVQAGEALPVHPLRRFCRDAGAKHCYDVDWTQMVARLSGDPVVFLSRPLSVFLEASSWVAGADEASFESLFGRARRPEAKVRSYRLAEAGEMLVETADQGIEIRWRSGPDGLWVAKRLGALEGGSVPPAARLLAAMDLQGDGRPELLLQRVVRTRKGSVTREESDSLILLHLNKAGNSFVELTRLTIHEY